MPTPTRNDASPCRLSVIAGYGIAIAQALEHKGVDSRRVFHAAGVPEMLTNDPLDRLPEAATAALYKASVAVTQDPYFGLTVAKFIQPSNFHVVGHALMVSKTLYDFCLRLERFFGIVTSSAMLRVERTNTEVSLRFRHLTLICGENQDACLAFVLRLMRLLYRPEFGPLRVEFHHACPAAGDAPYVRAFGIAPQFGCDESALVFPANQMQEPLHGACPELAQFNDKIARAYLARLDKSDVAARVRAKIVELLATGECSRRRVAREMAMSEPTLHIKLAQRDTSFNELLNETRKEMAQRYLAQRSPSVTEIAFLLGFADTSNFTRAFKRWMGVSPKLYRDQMLGHPG